MKAVHPGVQSIPSEVKDDLLEQVVFGCGYAGYKGVSEAKSASTALETALDYFKHIAEHVAAGIKDGTDIPVWCYSTKIHNLLRQTYVKESWKAESKRQNKDYYWQIGNSALLRQNLQSRHFEDLDHVIAAAECLGSGICSQSGSHHLDFSGMNFSKPRKHVASAIHPKYRSRTGLMTFSHPNHRVGAASTSQQHLHNHMIPYALPSSHPFTPPDSDHQFTELFSTHRPTSEGIFDAESYPPEQPNVSHSAHTTETMGAPLVEPDEYTAEDFDDIESLLNYSGTPDAALSTRN